jgi:hypothetical protein
MIASLADDLLIGAAPIAEFVFGDSSPPNRRRVYSLKDQLRLFHIGALLAGRKSTLTQLIADVEAGEATIAPPITQQSYAHRRRRRGRSGGQAAAEAGRGAS